MRCSRQTTIKLGKPKEGKILAVEAAYMHYYCFFLTECICKYSCSELCNSSAAFSIKMSKLNFPAHVYGFVTRAEEMLPMVRKVCAPAPQLGWSSWLWPHIGRVGSSPERPGSGSWEVMPHQFC